MQPLLNFAEFGAPVIHKSSIEYKTIRDGYVAAQYVAARYVAARYVAQGSILGLLLFILFMNDFSRSSTLLFSILFADDTSVFLEGTEYSKLIKSLNNEHENVTKWLNANRLTVNMKNTHYMIFHRAKFKTTGQDVVMQNSALTCVTTKFLGVIIDYKFKWNDHITYVKNKISKSIGILYKIRRFLDMNTLYKCTIHLFFHTSFTALRYGAMHQPYI